MTEQASAARQRLQNARSAREQAKPVEISGLAAMIAMASGANSDGIARGIGTAKALLFLALIDVLVWLSVLAMTLLGQAACREVTVEIVDVVATPVEPVAKSVAKPVLQLAKPVASGTKAYYPGRLEREYPQIAKRVQDGELGVHAASVAAGLRKAPAKSKWTTIDAYVSAKATA